MQGTYYPTVWLYSPDGNCQHQLASVPPGFETVTFNYGTFALLDRQVILCGVSQSKKCYVYDVASDSWQIYQTGLPLAQASQGVFHQGKIYLNDPNQPRVFDPATKTWANWTSPPSSSLKACFVSWKNYILRFGSDDTANQKTVYQYDPSSSSWSGPLSSSAPFDIYQSGCTTLPNGNVLVSGAPTNPPRPYFEYNVTGNSWSQVKYWTASLVNSLPLVLGKRVIVLPPSSPTVVLEYIYANATMVTAPYSIVAFIAAPAATVVPASWFSHLPGGCTGVF